MTHTWKCTQAPVHKRMVMTARRVLLRLLQQSTCSAFAMELVSQFRPSHWSYNRKSEIENYITGSCEFWHALTLTLAWIPSHFDLWLSLSRDSDSEMFFLFQDWTKPVITHHCRLGCCASIAESRPVLRKSIKVSAGWEVCLALNFKDTRFGLPSLGPCFRLSVANREVELGIWVHYGPCAPPTRFHHKPDIPVLSRWTQCGNCIRFYLWGPYVWWLDDAIASG